MAIPATALTEALLSATAGQAVDCRDQLVL